MYIMKQNDYNLAIRCKDATTFKGLVDGELSELYDVVIYGI